MKTEKQCSKCKETKPVSGFSKDASSKDGLRSWCKECQRQQRQRPEAKERKRQYQQRPEVKERAQQREQRPERKEYDRQYRQRPERKEYDRQRAQHPEQKEYQQQYRQNLRSQIIQLYGGQCFGCGNLHYGFLEIDHILGGGTQHIKECGSNYRMYKAILAESYRPDKYRVLCKACNQLVRWYSIGQIQKWFRPEYFPKSSEAAENSLLAARVWPVKS